VSRIRLVSQLMRPASQCTFQGFKAGKELFYSFASAWAPFMDSTLCTACPFAASSNNFQLLRQAYQEFLRPAEQGFAKLYENRRGWRTILVRHYHQVDLIPCSFLHHFLSRLGARYDRIEKFASVLTLATWCKSSLTMLEFPDLMAMLRGDCP
jgi:hypothetical protein